MLEHTFSALVLVLMAVSGLEPHVKLDIRREHRGIVNAKLEIVQGRLPVQEIGLCYLWQVELVHIGLLELLGLLRLRHPLSVHRKPEAPLDEFLMLLLVLGILQRGSARA